jgi:hypothetical protein
LADIIAAHDPADPIFISYRQSDGTGICAELAWLMRAGGIPVWRDRDDLPPGDTEERLRQAIGDGISGGVLITTPEVAKSDVVKRVEAPLLFASHKAHPSFALGIANAVERDPGKIDYSAPERLLGMGEGTLSGVDQHPTHRDGLRTVVQKMLWHRLATHREKVAQNDHTFSLSVQTRNAAQVYDRTGGQLDIRVRPSDHERLPSREGLIDMKDTIGFLPDAVTRAGARRIQVQGGAHLSVAFALGASLPSSRVGLMEVTDQQGNIWASDGEARFSSSPLVTIIESATNPSARKPGRPAVAAYVDLLNQRSNAAFEKYLEEHGGSLKSWIHVTNATAELLDPATAGSIAAEVAAHIRALSNENGNAEVHLLLRCPFPLAVLIGRLMNTLRGVLYEWDNSEPSTGDDFRPSYAATLRVRAGAPDGVIEEVLLS